VALSGLDRRPGSHGLVESPWRFHIPAVGGEKRKIRTLPKELEFSKHFNMGIGQNPIPLVDIRIACKWVFIALKKVSIGIDP